jgi:hypothetical protein
VFCTIVYILRPTANNRQFAMSEEIRQEDDDFDLSSLHDLELGEGDEDAELYNPPDHPPPPRERVEGDESSKPMLNRESEDVNAFSVGDDEFGTWAEEGNERSSNRDED